MKKTIALLLAFALSLAGCGVNNGQPSGGSTAPPKSSTASPSSPARSSEKPGEEFSATGIELNKGSEFNDFADAFAYAENVFYDIFFAYAKSNPEIDFMMPFRDVINTNFWFNDFFDMPDGTRLLDWPPLEATRQTSGGIVTIFVDDTLKDKYSVAEAGDHMRLEAALDTKNLTLNCERTLKRDGAYIERAVTEAVMLPDGTILFQRFIVGVDEVFGERIAVFKRISGDTYSAVVADIEPDYGYTYDSIIGRGDLTTEEMARGYTVMHVFTVENGEVGDEE